MKKLIILAVISVMAALLSFCTAPEYKQKTLAGTKVFPDLYSNIDMVDEIVISSRFGRIVILKNEDNVFVLPRFENFKVRPDRIKNIILGAALLEYFEKKTYSEDNYKELQLADVTEEKDNKSVRLILKSRQNVLFDAILGKDKMGLSGFSRGIFIRKYGENQVWLARKFFDATGDILSFINPFFPHIAAEDVKNISIKQHGNTLELKDKEKFPEPFTFFESLSFYDVAADKNQEVIAEYTYRLVGGIEVSVFKIKAEKGNPYIKLNVKKGKVASEDGIKKYNLLKEFEGRLYKINVDGLSKLPEIKNGGKH